MEITGNLEKRRQGPCPLGTYIIGEIQAIESLTDKYIIYIGR